MLFAFVAAVSFGNIDVQSHPSARLLDAPVLNKMPLPDLETQLDMELHKPSPFVVPAIAGGLAVLCGGIGSLFAFAADFTWKTLLAAGGFYLAALVGLVGALISLVEAVNEQSARNTRITQLRDEISKRKNAPGYPEELSPPPMPPSAQTLPAAPQLVLAHF